MNVAKKHLLFTGVLNLNNWNANKPLKSIVVCHKTHIFENMIAVMHEQVYRIRNLLTVIKSRKSPCPEKTVVINLFCSATYFELNIVGTLKMMKF